MKLGRRSRTLWYSRGETSGYCVMVRPHLIFHAFNSCAFKGIVVPLKGCILQAQAMADPWAIFSLTSLKTYLSIWYGTRICWNCWFVTFSHLYYHLLSKVVYSDRRTDSFSHAAVGYFFSLLSPQVAWPSPQHFPRRSLSEVLFASTDTTIEIRSL